MLAIRIALFPDHRPSACARPRRHYRRRARPCGNRQHQRQHQTGQHSTPSQNSPIRMQKRPSCIQTPQKPTTCMQKRPSCIQTLRKLTTCMQKRPFCIHLPAGKDHLASQAKGTSSPAKRARYVHCLLLHTQMHFSEWKVRPESSDGIVRKNECFGKPLFFGAVEALSFFRKRLSGNTGFPAARKGPSGHTSGGFCSRSKHNTL